MPVIQSGFSKVFASVEGSLLAKAASVALQYHTPVPEELLTSLIQDRAAAEGARIGALEGLSTQSPAVLEGMLPELLKDPKSKLRAAASRALLKIDPPKGIAETKKMANSENVRDRQAAYRNLADVAGPEVGNFFVKRLSNIESEMPGAVLDLLEAAESRDESLVKAALNFYRTKMPSDDPYAAFDVCLEGGDIERGKVIFLTHAAGQCAKCHRINKDGGEAGPDLTKLGERSGKEYILESLINPNKVVVPGYGIAIVNLEDGTNVGGTLMRQDQSEVVLKIPDPDSGQPVEKSFPMSEVASVNPPLSAMPPMNLILQKGEIRDLVAYLYDPRGKKQKAAKGHQ
jgi:quinoprotein glucose dehydrogenase